MNTRRGLNALLSQQLSDLIDGGLAVAAFLRAARTREAHLTHDLQTYVIEALEIAEDGLRVLETHHQARSAPRAGRSEVMRAMAREGVRSAEEWEISATRDAAIVGVLRSIGSFQQTQYRLCREAAKCLGHASLATDLKGLDERVSRLQRRLSRLAVGSWFAIGLGAEAATEGATEPTPEITGFKF